MPKILIVDDDPRLSASVEENLTAEGFKVEVSSTAADAAHRLELFDYDIILLDWELPDSSGVELCATYRKSGGKAPIMMMTGRDGITSKVGGFEAGVDDYVTKPVHPLELISRIRALLRRPPVFNSNMVRWHHVAVDTHNRCVFKNGEPIKLQPVDFNLLLFFLRHPNSVFPPERLILSCWNADEAVSNESVYSCIRRIRKTLDVEGQPSIIVTVHGAGYRLEADTTDGQNP